LKRSDAYGVLANRLEQHRSRGYEALRSIVNQPAASETVRLGNEDIVIEVGVVWKDKNRGTLCIWASALGPSTWMTERIDERMIVYPEK
jgi:hypothetical protein